eukprot:CAMPEP_0194311106 /NCGR_PEP_ID=MMETSP0171-20130528/8099_1 /TAXON_ID=218684 /ORGANISM="Corethron pennatum, Strain L29A3" /LENGTH=89 /DNA_ID=CAMNT_0039065075 /DNA_START=148 /DNA_END=417 /DNA_ORIENTATION=+
MRWRLTSSSVCNVEVAVLWGPAWMIRGVLSFVPFQAAQNAEDCTAGGALGPPSEITSSSKPGASNCTSNRKTNDKEYSTVTTVISMLTT